MILIVVLRPYFFDDQNVLGSSAPILCNFFCFLRSECITKARNGSFIVVVVFYEDPFGSKDAIIHKYQKADPIHFTNCQVHQFFFELDDLDETLSVLPVQDLTGERIIFLRGNMRKCLISVLVEGFEHD